MKLYDLLDPVVLNEMILQRYVSCQQHPSEPLSILNYTQRCQYDRVWNPVTRQCRGLIFDYETLDIVARPWPKFFNYGEYEEHGEDFELDLDALVSVTDKMDGSLGILYPTSDGYAIATRGSFTSEQALHATDVWRQRYDDVPIDPNLTFLFEIIFPENRIVVDYGGMDDLVLLNVLDTETGYTAPLSIADAPRYFGTNARNVWEVAAVRACADYIIEPKHWATYLGMDPARAEECLSLGDDWLKAVPDEFHEWVRETSAIAEATAADAYALALDYAEQVSAITERAERYAAVRQHPLVTEIMRVASAEGFEKAQGARNELWLRCWREACPEPTSPFARSEAVA